MPSVYLLLFHDANLLYIHINKIKPIAIHITSKSPLTSTDYSKYANLTSSWLVSSKYIQTPHGCFTLKDLCPRNHFGLTKKKLQVLIQDVISHNPGLSDQKVSNLLKRDGFVIARRTINKYRHLD